MSYRADQTKILLVIAAAITSLALTCQSSFAQVQRNFTNGTTVPLAGTNEQWFDENNWSTVGSPSTNKFAGFYISENFPATMGSANDLAFFGNPAVALDKAVQLDANLTTALSLGGMSFGSTGTIYQIEGYAGTVTLTLGGLGINTSTGNLTGAGNQVLVVSDASTQDVTLASSVAISLGVASGGSGGIYVKSGRTLTINSVISGTNRGITKSGDGVLLLSGANTYTGETLVNAGTLRVSGNDRISSGNVSVDGSTAVYDLQSFTESVAAVALRNGGTLSGSGTLTGTSYAFESGTASLNLAGAGSALTKTTTGVVTITGNNTYGGGTTLTAGTLRAGSNTAFGSGVIAINSGKISSNGATARSFTNNYTVGGNADLGDATDSGALTFSGTGTLSGNRTLTINSAITLSGAIGETGGAQGLTKAGLGTLTLSGNNTYSGGTTINAGSLALGASERLANGGSVTVNGGTFDVSSFNETVGVVTLTSGAIVGTTGILTGSSYAVQSGSVSAILGGAGVALNKTTAGSVTLSGANTYGGGTTVSAGTLVLGNNNVLANSGAVTVSGGTLNIGANSDSVGLVTLNSGVITGTTGVLTGTDYDVKSGTISAILGGAGVALTKSTTGTVTLSGANTYTGLTTISNGTLVLGASNVFADSGNITLAGGTLDIGANSDSVGLVTLNSGTITGTTGVLSGTDYDVKSGSISAILGGAGVALTKSTTDTVTLSGANTYTGLTTVNNGTLALGANNVFADSGNITVAGGTLDIGGNSDSVGLVTLNSGSITGTTGVLTGTDYDVKSGTISAILGGAGVALTKSTTGTVTLSGANSYTGGTNVNNGTLALGASNVLANGGAVTVGGGNFDIGANSDTVGQVTLNSGSITGTTGVLTASDYDVKSGTVSAILAGSGVALTKTTAGTVILSGANTYTGGTTISAGTLNLGNSNVLADSGAVTVSNGTLGIDGNSDTVGSVTLVSGSITGTTGVLTGASYNLQSGSISANLGGSGALNKTTVGGVTLSGNNSSVGAVSVSAGALELASGAALNAGLVTVSSGSTLDIDGTLTTLAGVTVDSGATLKGAGTVSANVNVNGSINPGNSPGTLAIVGNLNLGSSSILNFELQQNDQTAGGGVNDLITVDGDLVLDGTLNVPDATTILNWTTSGSFASPLSWTLFTFTGSLTDNGLNLGNLPVLTGTPAPQQWELKIVLGPSGGGSVNLNAVPEPSAALVLSGLLAGAACLRRRRVA